LVRRRTEPGDGEAAKPDRLVALGLPDLATSPNGTRFVDPDPDEDPDRWIAADPQQNTAANSELRALFIHAENDNVVPLRATTSMVEGLTEAGAQGVLFELADLGHFDLVEPTHVGEADLGHFDLVEPTHVGETLIAWLQP
jgi:pimeloyl-ACP methyl ester carboxylesterase